MYLAFFPVSPFEAMQIGNVPQVPSQLNRLVANCGVSATLITKDVQTAIPVTLEDIVWVIGLNETSFWCSDL